MSLNLQELFPEKNSVYQAWQCPIKYKEVKWTYGSNNILNDIWRCHNCKTDLSVDEIKEIRPIFEEKTYDESQRFVICPHCEDSCFQIGTSRKCCYGT